MRGGNRAETNSWTDTNGVPLAEAAAKEKIKRRDSPKNEALIAARRVANEFGNELFSQNQRQRPFREPGAAGPPAGAYRHMSPRPFVVRAFGSWDQWPWKEFDNEPVPGRPVRTNNVPDLLARRSSAERPPGSPTNEPSCSSPNPRPATVAYLIARKGQGPERNHSRWKKKIADKVTTDLQKTIPRSIWARKKPASLSHTISTNGLALKEVVHGIMRSRKGNGHYSAAVFPEQRLP